MSYISDTSVSYTHLDVYKRQVLPAVIGGLIGFFVPRKAKAAEEA